MRAETKILLVTSFAAAVSALDLMLMFVAFPEIRATFDTVPTAQISWVLTSFTIVAASLLIAAGRLADRVGRRRVFLAGLSLFTLGSFLSAIAPIVPLLIAARVVQAVGGAMLTPASLSIIMATYPPHRRATAIAVWSVVSGTMSSLAPTIGAVIIDLASWRWAFFINVPIGLFSLVVGRRVIVESVDDDAAPMPDRVGIVVGMLAVASLAFAIVQTDEWGWIDRRTGLAALGAVVLLGAFLYRCATHPEPVISLGLYSRPMFSAASLGAFAVGFSFFGSFFVFIQFLTRAWDYSILATGFRLTPLTAASVVVSYPAGRLMDRYGHTWVMVFAGAAFTAGIGVLALFAGDERNLLGVWLPAMVLVGIGVGIYLPGVNGAGAFGIPPHQLGLSAGMIQTLIRIGGVTGTATAIALVGSFAAGDPTSEFLPALTLFASVGAVLMLVALPMRTRHVTAEGSPIASSA